MADMYGSHFEYGGVLSRKYGLIIVNAETSRFRRLSGEIKGNTIFNKNSKQRLLTGNDYSSFPVSFDVDIITDNEKGIPLHERRVIEKWLFNRREYKKLYIDNGVWDDPYSESHELVDGVEKRLYLNCRFLNPEKLEYNGGIIGYKATLETDSGLWWQDTIELTFQRSQVDTVGTWRVTVPVDTDLDDYTYPKVTFYTGVNGGSLVFANTTDSASRQTKFKELPSRTSFTVDGAINYVSNDLYRKMQTQFFPRLLDGENVFTIKGDVSMVVFEYNNRRML